MTLDSPLKLAGFLCAMGLSPAARAESDVSGATLGDTPWALPGIARVGVPASAEHKLALAGSTGYAFTEGVGAQQGANHRAAGALALGVFPTRWLELALRVDGRYDVHPTDERGPDSGGVGDARAAARLGARLLRRLHAGFELDVWFPGAEAPSIVTDAITLDARGLLAWRAPNGLLVGGLAGFRFDRSYAAEQHPEQLRIGDRAALGLSESNAALVGVGVLQPVGAFELFGELSADLLVGAGAPDALDSPLRLTVGARYRLSRALEAQVWSELSFSGRPPVGPDDPLVPLEPRAAGSIGLSYRWESRRPASPATLVTDAPAARAKAEPAVPPPLESPKTLVTGAVKDESGQPVPDARVRIVIGDESHELRTAAEGQFELELSAGGRAKVVVSAEGFEPVETEVALEPGHPPALDVTMVPAVPAGQLKGLVRSYDGQGMPATIRVREIGVEVLADEGGAFEINVPPGTYEVEVDAPGYVSQRRTVRVENRGVTVLNADLRGKP